MDRRLLEALAEAMVRYSGYQQPDSSLYLARNPGGLKAHSPVHPRDEEGNRIFLSMLDGMQALLFDVDLKVSGRSRAHLKPTSTLQELAESYQQPVTTAQAWARFLRAALRDESVTQKTTMGYFLGEKQ